LEGEKSPMPETPFGNLQLMVGELTCPIVTPLDLSHQGRQFFQILETRFQTDQNNQLKNRDPVIERAGHKPSAHVWHNRENFVVV
jgi:hypothetical protein